MDGTLDTVTENVLDDLCVRFILNCPEEIYSSHERLFFKLEEAHWFYEDFYRRHFNLPVVTFEEFADQVFQHLKLPKNDLLTNLKKFTSYKSKVPVYGAVILNKSLDKVLLVQHYRSTTWGFPKGKINKDETDVQCAIREVKEETGFDLTDLVEPEIFIDLQDKNKEGKLFIIQGISESTKFSAQTRHEIRKIQWHDVSLILNLQQGIKQQQSVSNHKPLSPSSISSPPSFWKVHSTLSLIFKKKLVVRSSTAMSPVGSSKQESSVLIARRSSSPSLNKSPSKSPMPKQHNSSRVNNGTTKDFQKNLQNTPIYIKEGDEFIKKNGGDTGSAIKENSKKNSLLNFSFDTNDIFSG
jgi:8-oxo-dGTP pyrophosphatase MutT (NUDIX family)